VYVRSAAWWLPGAGGEGGALMTGPVVRESVTLAGRAERARAARAFLGAGDGVVRVEVTDRGGPGAPELRPVDRHAEGGRGLQLVERIARRWGWRRRGGCTVTWFELSHG
jgi:hypothetical protein